MSAIQELSQQLTALSESLKTTNTLISRLHKLKFVPGSEPLDADGGVRVELAQDIHHSLKQLEEELEFLKQEAEEYTTDGDRYRRHSSNDGEEARLQAKVVRLKDELNHSRQKYRNAQVAAKFASDEAKRREREAVLEGYRKEAEQLAAAGEQPNGSTGNDRELLFASRGRRTQQQKQLTKDEILVDASNDLTSGLRRTYDLLSTELSRSRFAQETFDESTAALAQLGEDYTSLDSILSNSRNLLGTLLRSQKSDTWYLENAFRILIITLVWLFFRRILYGPFFKLPLFLWNVFALFTNWLFLKPLFFLLSATGILTTGPASTTSIAASSSSRAPLIVQPSATGKPHTRPSHISAGQPVGLGGTGAKLPPDPELEGRISESIAKMAQESARNDLPRRGDGTVLEERGDVPANPKKKNFEADVEDAKQAEKEPQRRGDGTILEERDEPANPKKKTFEADVEDGKRAKRDEL
ncbi:hypothetical protein CLAFUW4_07915 [Fulvia fulva]|uniref:Sec20 C-terminal domain-containing protein n=1 Tax=Passalora fulva TaxID=5499 RepID=A0A9Q8LD30_PASFU|nr:uncharacterized protein CLAFUR5_08039 [Fulvia fulva]KAK4628860.1 hypothetical protein CLAFUR4_07920 [Fulvia fulva]KAK4630074.1 hypothetical protein CLAFUR0_07917 [Fulvia fulva]UJO15321.1 hypothetical protein CLAFUR5_08039 [Fulvia fulva]WPV12433.1 hypothetical protein CLAFUW4_07915 [Fulvia fulva]WPV27336.1 hypothetical protein CLAFUW7_07916 [Fulvia fulva]